MSPDNSTVDPAARRAAIYLLSQGLATPSEVAELAAVSRQLIRYWLSREKFDWQKARNARLVKSWRTARG